VLEGVSFQYPGAPAPALCDITFTLRAGERVALVSENGSGKTTLAKILTGLFRPTAGTRGGVRRRDGKSWGNFWKLAQNLSTDFDIIPTCG
jgi:ABC-type multidrug transport system fused ATPase/permease subunit